MNVEAHPCTYGPDCQRSTLKEWHTPAGDTESAETGRVVSALLSPKPGLVAAVSANPAAAAKFAALTFTAPAHSSSHTAGQPMCDSCDTSSPAPLASVLTQALTAASDTTRSIFASVLSCELHSGTDSISSARRHKQPGPLSDGNGSMLAAQIKRLAFAVAFTCHPYFLAELQKACEYHRKQSDLQSSKALIAAEQAAITQHLLLCPAPSSAMTLQPSTEGSQDDGTDGVCGLGQILHVLLPLLQPYLESAMHKWLQAQVQVCTKLC